MNYKLSLYEPVEIEIEGVRYKVKKRNRAMFRAMTEIKKKYEATQDVNEKLDINYDQLRIFLDAPPEVIDDLNIDQVKEAWDAINKITAGSSRPEPETESDLKNGPKPGDVPAP